MTWHEPYRALRSQRGFHVARRTPRYSRLGLGLLDVMLAVVVLSGAALWGGQVAGRWIEDRVAANEARTLASLARAGRLLVEGNLNHPIRGAGVDTTPQSITFAALEAADLRSPVAGSLTPGRRQMTLWLWRSHDDRALVIARARGEVPLRATPGAETGVTGVGVIPDEGTALRGPGVQFDMSTITTAPDGFSQVGDLFALDQVWLDAPCRSYLYRVVVPGCTDANTMETDLDMGGQAIVNAERVEADTAAIQTLDGATSVTGDLSVDGTLEAAGDTSLRGLTVSGAAGFTEGLTVGETLTVSEDLTVTGTLAGSDLSFTGTVTVSGDARMGDVTATTVTAQTLTTNTLSATTGEVDTLFADDVTVSTCGGCKP